MLEIYRDKGFMCLRNGMLLARQSLGKRAAGEGRMFVFSSKSIKSDPNCYHR